jgi:hypothetical protein
MRDCQVDTLDYSSPFVLLLIIILCIVPKLYLSLGGVMRIIKRGLKLGVGLKLSILLDLILCFILFLLNFLLLLLMKLVKSFMSGLSRLVTVLHFFHFNFNRLFVKLWVLYFVKHTILLLLHVFDLFLLLIQKSILVLHNLIHGSVLCFCSGVLGYFSH